MVVITVSVLGGREAVGGAHNRISGSRNIDTDLIEILHQEFGANPPRLSLFNGSGAPPTEGRPQVHFDVSGESGEELAARIGGLEEVSVANSDGAFAKDPADRVVQRAWLNPGRVRNARIHPRPGALADDASITFHSWRVVYLSQPSAAVLALAGS